MDPTVRFDSDFSLCSHSPPSGGPGHAIPASNSAAVFIVGGSGITYALAGIEELIQKDLKGESRTKIIELVWIIQDPGTVKLSTLHHSLLTDVS